MTGYESKKAAAQAKLEDDDTQVYQTELTKLLMESYDKGVADALEETKAAQRPWVGLTEEERKGIWNVGEKKDQALRALLIQAIRDIEAKLKERNT